MQALCVMPPSPLHSQENTELPALSLSLIIVLMEEEEEGLKKKKNWTFPCFPGAGRRRREDCNMLYGTNLWLAWRNASLQAAPTTYHHLPPLTPMVPT